MNTKIVLLVLIAMMVNSCNKNEFTTNPQLTLQSVNTRVLNQGDQLIFTFNFKQQSGGLDSLFISRVPLVCTDTDIIKNLSNQVPPFTAIKDQTGQLIVSFVYNEAGTGLVSISNGTCPKTDTSLFKFCLQDNAGHLSDTVVSPKIALMR